MTREDAPSFHFGRRAKLTYVVMLVPALLLLFASLYPFLQGILTALTNRKLYLGT